MKNPAQTQLDLGDGVTVYVYASDGALLDVIEGVDLGDRHEAWSNGRTSLYEASMWGALAADRYRRTTSTTTPSTTAEPRRRSPRDATSEP